MTGLPYTTKIFTVPEYLAMEIESGQKLEYYNGKLRPMAGGTIPHNRIARNVLAELHFSLKEGFEAFGSDQKIYLPKYEFYVYPDAVVVAGLPIETEAEANAIVNPILIIEVLSPSTSGHDKGDKFMQYKSLPSFKEYALIRQDAAEIETLFREEPDLWRSREFVGLDNQLHLNSVDISIDLKKIYKNVDFEEIAH